MSADIDTQIRQAWEDVKIPQSLINPYGDFRIWDYDGQVSRYHMAYNSLVDRRCLWIVAQSEEDRDRQSEYYKAGNFNQPRSFGVTAAGIAFNPRTEIPVIAMLQATIDQWETLSHPIIDGDILPEPRNLFFEQDADGATLPLTQSRTFTTMLHGRELAYAYNRNEYRIERIAELCDEQQEAFKLVKRG